MYKHLLTLLLLLLTTACANPGSGPDGGPYDETPPRIIAMSPALGERGTHSAKVAILFDENIKVENPTEKVTISPPQLITPEIKVAGRRISVELLDTLRDNTTYTIDFSDAISDATEGNPLGNFTYYFSTGTRLDTLEVAGHVLAAANLEPVKGILVGLYADTARSVFAEQPLARVARTDSRGHFVIKGVAPGSYTVYALKDMDGDFRRSRGEMIAELGRVITPSSFADVRNDTLWRDTVRYDSIRTVPFTHFLPDDLVLRAYTERPTARYFLKSERANPEMFRFYFTAPGERVPVLRGLNFDADTLLLADRTAGNDTLTYWLRTLDFPLVDSLRMTLTYDAFDDSLRTNTERTDTFELIPRNTMARRLRLKAEEMDKWRKQLERRHKRGDFSQEVPPQDYLDLRSGTGRSLAPDRNPTFATAEPIMHIDTSRIHLELLKDSVGIPVPWEMDLAAGDAPMRFALRGEWRYGQQYALVIDSAAVIGLSGRVNEARSLNFSIGREDEFGTLFVTLPDADPSAVVQLLLNDDKVERQVRVEQGRADFFFIRPGKYYLRLFYDRNGNGQWDTGDFEAQRQPEEVYYFPTSFEIRANWDFEQTWRVNELPLTRQKPDALTRQKGDIKRQTARSRNEERLRQRGQR